VFWTILDITTIPSENTLTLHPLVVRSIPFSKSPFLGHEDLLTSRVLELSTPEGLNSGCLMFVQSSDTHNGLSDPYTSYSAEGFSESSSHSSLKPISSSTGQHFIDANDMEGMESHPDVELIFPTKLDQVFVTTNSTGLKGL